MKNLGMLLTVLGCISYLVWVGVGAFTPPVLTIYSPHDNTKVSKDSIEVSGWTDTEAELSINGELVLKQADGHFSQSVTLVEGVNVIKISSVGKYSKEQVVYRNVMLVSDSQYDVSRIFYQ